MCRFRKMMKFFIGILSIIAGVLLLYYMVDSYFSGVSSSAIAAASDKKGAVELGLLLMSLIVGPGLLGFGCYELLDFRRMKCE